MKKIALILMSTCYFLTAESSYSAIIDEQQCLKEEAADHCGKAGVDYFLGANGVRKSTEKAVRLAKKGCEMFSGHSCQILGLMHRDLGEIDLAEIALIKAIELKDPVAFINLADLYSEPKYHLINLERAQEILKQGCAQTSSSKARAFACYKLIENFKDMGEPFSALETRCDKGDKWSCEVLGLMYENIFHQKEKAISPYIKACDLGVPSSCALVSGILGARRDYRGAYRYGKKGCDLGDATSCWHTSSAIYHLEENTQLSKGQGVSFLTIAEKQLPYLEKAYSLDPWHGTAGTALGEVLITLGRYVEGTNLLEDRCNQNDALACSSLSQVYQLGQGREVNLKNADLLHQRACKLNGRMCRNYAAFIEQQFGRNEKYYHLLQKACDSGDPEGCARYGFRYAFGSTAEQSPALAEKYFKKSCDGDFAMGCVLLLALYEKTGSQKPTEIRELTLKACRLGNGGACTNVGIAHSHGYGVLKNKQKSQLYLEKACALGDPQGCLNLGVNAINEKDIVNASKYFEKGCLIDNDGGACNEWAKTLAHVGNFSKAKQVLQTSCEIKGFLKSCRLLGINYFYPQLGGNVDYKKGTTILSAACERGDAESCAFVSLHFLSPMVGKEQKAKDLAEQGCNLGNLSSCETLGEILINEGNVGQGLTLLEKSCNQGKIDACSTLGARLYLLPEPHGNVKKAIQFLEEAAPLDDSAKIFLAYIYAIGVKVPKDKTKSLNYLKQVEDQNDPVAQYIAGLVYYMHGMQTQARLELDKACNNGLELGCNGIK